MPKFFNRLRSSWLKEGNKNKLQKKTNDIAPANSTVTPTKSDNNDKTIPFPSFLPAEYINDGNNAAIPAVSPTMNGNDTSSQSNNLDDIIIPLSNFSLAEVTKDSDAPDIRVISPTKHNADDCMPSVHTSCTPVSNIDDGMSCGPNDLPEVEENKPQQRLLLNGGKYKGHYATLTGSMTAATVEIEVELKDGSKKITSIHKKNATIFFLSNNDSPTAPDALLDCSEGQNNCAVFSAIEEKKPQQRLLLNGGKYKGRYATLTGSMTAATVEVEVELKDGSKKITSIQKKNASIFFLSNNDSPTALEALLDFSEGQKNNASPSAYNRSTMSTQPRRENANKKQLEPLDWFPNWKHPGPRISGRSLHKIVLFKKSRTSLLSDYKNPSFFDFLVRDQQLEKIVPLSSPNEESFIPIEKEFTEHGITYALVGAKLDETKDNFNYNAQLRLIFVAIRGDETAAQKIVPFNPEESFNRLANFGALSPRKAKARLELLFTPSSALIPLDSSQFEEIEERGNVGCGYIPDALLDSILGCTAKSKRIIAIQVRIFSSKLGIFKGMLFRKPFITQIQLPPSMLKVGPSIVSDLNEEELKSVIMLITMNGQHPGDLNHYIHRHLNHDSRGVKPPPVSFDKKIKPLSEMIHHVWYGWGVSKSMCETYSKRARDSRGLKHAWVVGVSDCTKFLPSGHVFVTGMGHKRIANKVFVTRSPCTERADGRLLPIVTTKPDLMPSQYWDFLCQLHFGAIMFADPDVHDNGNFTLSLPETINDGDLDGDLYFICWDADILEIIENNKETECPKIALMESTADVEVEPNVEAVNNPGWLSHAQDVMTDLSGAQCLRELIGTLYSLHLKMAKENKQEDDIAFGRAYKKALELEKHGGKIQLPSHLHHRLGERLQSFLAT